MDFFIINDAIIQKICILGDDVEPCFEGASVTAPDVSTKFTLDDNFRHTLYSMMQDLKNALNGGGQQMENLENTVVVENENTDPATEFTQAEEVNAETTPEVNDNTEDTSAPADYVKRMMKRMISPQIMRAEMILMMILMMTRMTKMMMIRRVLKSMSYLKKSLIL